MLKIEDNGRLLSEYTIFYVSTFVLFQYSNKTYWITRIYVVKNCFFLFNYTVDVCQSINL